MLSYSRHGPEEERLDHYGQGVCLVLNTDVKAVEGLGEVKLRYCNKNKASVHCNYHNTDVLVNMRRLVGSWYL